MKTNEIRQRADVAPIEIEDRLYTPNEVARLLSCSRDTVERLVRHKRIQVRRVPSAAGVRSNPRFTRSAILAYIDAGYIEGLK